MSGLQINDFNSAELFRLDSHDSIPLTRQTAHEYWARVCGLPSAVSARCHFPVFGIRFIHDCKEIGLATICWECNNVRLRFKNQQDLLTFDGSSQAARQLLEDTRAMFRADQSQQDIKA